MDYIRQKSHFHDYIIQKSHFHLQQQQNETNKKEEKTNKKEKQKNKLTQAVKDYTFQSIPGGSNDVKITFLAIPKNQTSKETTNFKKKETNKTMWSHGSACNWV